MNRNSTVEEATRDVTYSDGGKFAYFRGKRYVLDEKSGYYLHVEPGFGNSRREAANESIG